MTVVANLHCQWFINTDPSNPHENLLGKNHSSLPFPSGTKKTGGWRGK